MKIIITGATGLVGGALVRQCIQDERITNALVVTRRPLPEKLSNNEKITVIEHKDFSTFPPELLERLSGAEGCLWYVSGAHVTAFRARGQQWQI